MKGSARITPALKQQIWTFYIGSSIQETPCPLCGLYKIYNNVNSGFEAAHVVARKFNPSELNAYYLYPSCSACNNECSDMCLLDYLWARGRFASLRKMITSIYAHFLEEHDRELRNEDRFAWKILDHLYGPLRFKSGGGIQNTRQIYELARVEQHLVLVEKAKVLAQKQEDVAKEMRLLMEGEIKPMML